MKESEAGRLLSLASSFDSREVTDERMKAWALALDGRVGFEDACRAVVAHYAVSSEWLMPADVNRTVMKIRSDRLNAAGTMADPLPLPEQSEADYRRVLVEHRRKIADGTVTPEPLEPFRPLPVVKPGMRSLGQSLAELPTR